VLLALPQTVPGLTSLQFRMLLGAGALPALVVLNASLSEPGGVSVQRPWNLLESIRNPAHWLALIGTAGTWFLFDVAFYGTMVFIPTILQSVFGAEQSLRDLAMRATMMSVLGIFGMALGLIILPKVGPRAMNTWGLALASVTFGAFASVYRRSPEQSVVLFSFLCVSIFVLNMGPGIATYLLPVEVFPREVRSTFHGLSAAAAKVGAVVGALLFPIISDRFGVPAVMLTQAAFCATGALLSHVAVPSAAAARSVPAKRSAPTKVERAKLVG